MRLACLLLLFPILINSAFAQPSGYYNTAANLNGTPLKLALHNIIDNHNSLGYSNLWDHFDETDLRPGTNKIWDIYSDIPGGTPPYLYTFNSDKCGQYDSESDCYNREHTWPQSYFSNQEPMLSDLFHIYPTDGFVNGKRSNDPYGEVGNASYTSQNGSKSGNSNFAGFSGTVFEPRDEFKGDLARTYFYMATRYYNEDNNFTDWTMANGANLTPYAIALLLSWHHQDTVSQKEKNRNNAIYNLQNNRNPFIDHPEYADCIWGTGNCAQGTGINTLAESRAVTAFPNPAIAGSVVRIDCEGAETLDVVSVLGQVVSRAAFSSGRATVATDGLVAGVYLLKANGKAGYLGALRLAVQ